MRRSWSDTHAKAATAHGCRVCGRGGALQRAHVIGRARDGGVVAAEAIVMLCGPTPAGCHGAYDHGRLDLYPHLTDAERAHAVAAAGGPGHALRRMSAPLWRDPGAGPVLDARLEHLTTLTPGG